IFANTATNAKIASITRVGNATISAIAERGRIFSIPFNKGEPKLRIPLQSMSQDIKTSILSTSTQVKMSFRMKHRPASSMID
ncbi:MAG: hypothetical protein Q9177_006919, partial [Variospora cf. flavescens]